MLKRRPEGDLRSKAKETWSSDITHDEDLLPQNLQRRNMEPTHEEARHKQSARGWTGPERCSQNLRLSALTPMPARLRQEPSWGTPLGGTQSRPVGLGC